MIMRICVHVIETGEIKAAYDKDKYGKEPTLSGWKQDLGTAFWECAKDKGFDHIIEFLYEYYQLELDWEDKDCAHLQRSQQSRYDKLNNELFRFINPNQEASISRETTKGGYLNLPNNKDNGFVWRDIMAQKNNGWTRKPSEMWGAVVYNTKKDLYYNNFKNQIWTSSTQMKGWKSKWIKSGKNAHRGYSNILSAHAGMNIFAHIYI